MYNIYCEEKKLLEEGQKLKQKKDMVLYQEKHKKKTDSLVNNYQNRIRKFIIDVSKKYKFYYNYIY